jgi:hypothetical protein
MRKETSKWQFRWQLIWRTRASMPATAAQTLIHLEKSSSGLKLNHPKLK